MDWTANHIMITTDTDLSDMPSSLPACEWLDAMGCTGLTELPDLPACKTLYASGCTGLIPTRVQDALRERLHGYLPTDCVVVR